MMVRICNPSPQKAEAGRYLGFKIKVLFCFLFFFKGKKIKLPFKSKRKNPKKKKASMSSEIIYQGTKVQFIMELLLGSLQYNNLLDII